MLNGRARDVSCQSLHALVLNSAPSSWQRGAVETMKRLQIVEPLLGSVSLSLDLLTIFKARCLLCTEKLGGFLYSRVIQSVLCASVVMHPFNDCYNKNCFFLCTSVQYINLFTLGFLVQLTFGCRNWRTQFPIGVSLTALRVITYTPILSSPLPL